MKTTVKTMKMTGAPRLQTGDSLRVPRLASSQRAAASVGKSHGGGCSDSLVRQRLHSSRAGGRVKYRKRRPRSERGITLQTLIITAVVVVIAIGVGLLFIALTSSSSEDLEDAGRTGQDAACAPHELLDAVYYRRGLGGPNSPDGVPTRAKGCKPYCATWEFVATPSAGGEYRLGGTGEGSPIGGPEGLGGVFSSNVGCFAPCYWEVGKDGSEPKYDSMRTKELIGVDILENGLPGEDGEEYPDSRLRYYNDNRPPDAGVIRMGVTYRRILEDSPHRGRSDTGLVATELRPNYVIRNNRVVWHSHDGKPFFYTRGGSTQGWANGVGVRNAPATPLLPEQISNNVPTVHTPNWRNTGREVSGRFGRFNTGWEDEDWEVRADPESEVCEIVYTPTDRLICSSANNSCLESNRAEEECPTGTYFPDDPDALDYVGTPVCRLP